MPFDLVVSIINFRTGDLTLECVRSVLDDMAGINGLVVVVDNLSGDGSAEQIEAWIAAQPEGTPVRLVRSATNSGFSGAQPGHRGGRGRLLPRAELRRGAAAGLPGRDHGGGPHRGSGRPVRAGDRI
ncbi:glycosyltransferase family 2 protein [Seohaeicola zhoushanensis]